MAVAAEPTLAELIMQDNNYDTLNAKKLVETLKEFWREDIRKQESQNETWVELSITKAKREQKGIVKVRGKIIGISAVFGLFAVGQEAGGQEKGQA